VISANVPGPQGNRRLTFLDENLQPLDEHLLSDFLFHPLVRADLAPRFDLFACDTDDMSARLGRAARDRFHRADVAAVEDSMSALREKFTEQSGFFVGRVACFGLGTAEYAYFHSDQFPVFSFQYPRFGMR
jgi:hypothetical protein